MWSSQTLPVAFMRLDEKIMPTTLEQQRPFVIPDTDAQDRNIRTFYTSYYKDKRRDGQNKMQENKDDSPYKSRKSLIERLYPHINALQEDGLVLDVGAGRQILEKEYQDRYGKPPCQIITLDIADLPQELLLANGYPHVQATGRHLPFSDEKFDILFSNMALEFALPDAREELYRVVKPGALVLLNLLHSSFLEYDIQRSQSKVKKKITHTENAGKTPREQHTLKMGMLHSHQYLKDNRRIFQSRYQINQFFEDGGFEVKNIGINHYPANKWWEVDLVKPRKELPLAGPIFDSKGNSHR